MKNLLRSILALEHTKQNLNLDAPETNVLHSKIIQSKPFLKRYYEDQYKKLIDESIDSPNGLKVEIGSGGGFFKKMYPELITTDILNLPNIDKVFSANKMELDDNSVSTFFMLNVFHHIPNSRIFLNEVNRCLNKNGLLVMIEPANTPWAKFIYQNLHHEPFQTDSDWKLPEGGPMSEANGALPWIVFERDKDKLKKEYPNLVIEKVGYFDPIIYLLSGGVSMKQLVPNSSYSLIKNILRMLQPINKLTGMFMLIKVRKIK